MIQKARGPVLGATMLASVAATLVLFSPPANPGRRAWDLTLMVKVEGVYQVTVKGASYSGDYAFTLAWSGKMEEDDDDYRLVQREVRLLDWRADETTTAAGARALKTTTDFPELPAFHHVYVLREKGFFHIEFALSGFGVPVHETDEKAFLDLPRTAQSRVLESEVVYNTHVRRGSNSIRIPAALIFAPPLERTFDWGWQHRQWSYGREQVVSLSNSHRAMVEMRLQPARPERP